MAQQLTATGPLASAASSRAAGRGSPWRLSRLVVLYTVLSYGMLLALALSAIAFGSSAVRSQVDSRLEASASASAEYVGQILRGRSAIVSAFATRSSLITALEDSPRTPADITKMNSILDLLQSSIDGAFNTWVVDPKAVTLAVSPREPSLIGVSFTDRDWYSGIMSGKAPYLSTTYVSAATGHPLVVAAVDRILGSSGQLIGIIGATFDLSRLQSFVDGFSSAQGVGIVITDQAGMLIARPGGNINALVRSSDPQVGRALAGHSGGGSDTAGGQVTAFAPVPWAGWALVASVDGATAFGQLYTMERSVGLTAGLLALVNLGMIVYLNGSIRRRAGAERELETANRELKRRLAGASMLASIVEGSEDAIISKSLDGVITGWNPAAVSMYGYTAEEVVGTSIDMLMRPEQREEEQTAILSRIRSGGRVKHYETERIRKDGSTVPVSLSVSPIKDQAGHVIGASSIARDITEQRQASRYARSLIEASLDPLVTISPSGKITDVNEATARVTGVGRADLIGSDFSDYFTEPEMARAGYLQVFEKGSVIDYPLTLRGVDGHLTPVLYNATLYRDVDGKVLGAFAAARDITEQRQAWVYARSLIEASLDPLVTISAEGIITDVNEATIKATGIGRDALVGTDFSSYFTEPERAREGYQRAFDEGKVRDFPLTLRSVGGRSTPVLYNAAVYRGVDGNVKGVFAAARDVTVQKAAEEAVKTMNRTLEEKVSERTSQLEASNRELEAFTYSVSHDLRAPLRALSGFSALVLKREAASLDADGVQYLQRIEANANKMGVLIDELLRFSRLGKAAMSIETLDPTQIARAAVNTLSEAKMAGGVQIVVDDLPSCRADRDLLLQVYTNLIANAIKFSQGRPDACVHVTSHREGSLTVYDVCDNGVGFDMRYVGKLFGVFQRLHSESEFEGTGVGLALVQRIVHRHGGRVWAEGEVGKGATFHFTLEGGTQT